MDLTPQTFAALSAYVRRLSGLAVTEDKAYLLSQRLEPIARASRCSGLDDFARALPGIDSPWLRERVIEAMTTFETSFLRDGHPFDTIRTHLLPRLAAGRVRLWSAGTSSGQEAYSLAMTVLDYIDTDTLRRPDDYSVLATDLSARALAEARAAAYPDREVRRGLGAAHIQRYLTPSGADWSVRESVRRLVEFRRVNLVGPFADLGPFDGILCRNVLIYFDDDTRRRVCERFHDVLAPGGFLLLGAAESLYGVTGLFSVEHYGRTIVYRKPPGRALPGG